MKIRSSLYSIKASIRTYVSTYHTYVQQFIFLHIADVLICNISSPSFNAIGVSCELLGNLPRVNITVKCTSCTSNFKPYSVITDGPIIIANLPAGNYTVDVVFVDSVYTDITTTEMIVVSNDVTTNITNRPAIEPTGITCTGILLCYNMYATICVCHTAGKFGR